MLYVQLPVPTCYGPLFWSCNHSSSQCCPPSTIQRLDCQPVIPVFPSIKFLLAPSNSPSKAMMHCRDHLHITITQLTKKRRQAHVLLGICLFVQKRPFRVSHTCASPSPSHVGHVQSDDRSLDLKAPARNQSSSGSPRVGDINASPTMRSSRVLIRTV